MGPQKQNAHCTNSEWAQSRRSPGRPSRPLRALGQRSGAGDTGLSEPRWSSRTVLHRDYGLQSSPGSLHTKPPVTDCGLGDWQPQHLFRSCEQFVGQVGRALRRKVEFFYRACLRIKLGHHTALSVEEVP